MKLEEVARRARVSTATVSRVLNDTARVKEATRARVLKVIEELEIHPNLPARSLAGGRSRSIGVIVSNIENPFFLDVYKTVEPGAHAAGYDVIMANTDYSSERLVTSIRLMLGRRLAGLAAIVSEMDATLIQELSSQRIPVVFYDVGTPRRNITNIRVDYRARDGQADVVSLQPGPSPRGLRRPPRRWARSTSGSRPCAMPSRSPASRWTSPPTPTRSKAAARRPDAARQVAAPDGAGLRQRRDGGRRAARAAGARPPGARGRVGDRLRQRHAGAVRGARR